MPEAVPSATALPDELTTRDQWVCWRTQTRNKEQTKVPINPETATFASTTKPETWTSFDRAHERATNDDLGLGFVFTDSDPIVGVDLDDCRDSDTGEMEPIAETIIERLDSYTEVSPSGTGYHVLALGTLPGGRNRRKKIEIYETARFFTVTGDHVSSTPSTLATADEALTTVYNNHLDPSNRRSETDATTDGDENTATQATGVSTAESDTTTESDVSLSDEQLVAKAQAAANGEKFSRLWNGQTSGYESHSEADMALCSLLAFWTGGNPTQMDRLFRQSGLMREKWDTVHYADGRTYGETTIERAIEGCSSFYDPEQTEEDATEADRTARSTTGSSGTTPTAVRNSDPAPNVTGGAAADTDAGALADQVTALTADLEDALERNTQLQLELDAERERRRELEEQVAEHSERWWQSVWRWITDQVSVR